MKALVKVFGDVPKNVRWRWRLLQMVYSCLFFLL